MLIKTIANRFAKTVVAKVSISNEHRNISEKLYICNVIVYYAWHFKDEEEGQRSQEDRNKKGRNKKACCKKNS